MKTLIWFVEWGKNKLGPGRLVGYADFDGDTCPVEYTSKGYPSPVTGNPAAMRLICADPPSVPATDAYTYTCGSATAWLDWMSGGRPRPEIVPFDGEIKRIELPPFS